MSKKKKSQGDEEAGLTSHLGKGICCDCFVLPDTKSAAVCLRDHSGVGEGEPPSPGGYKYKFNIKPDW